MFGRVRDRGVHHYRYRDVHVVEFRNRVVDIGRVVAFLFVHGVQAATGTARTGPSYEQKLAPARLDPDVPVNKAPRERSAEHQLFPVVVLRVFGWVRYDRHGQRFVRVARTMHGRARTKRPCGDRPLVRRHRGVRLAPISGKNKMVLANRAGDKPHAARVTTPVGLRRVFHKRNRLEETNRAVHLGRLVRRVFRVSAGVRKSRVQRADSKRTRGGYVRVVRNHGQRKFLARPAHFRGGGADHGPNPAGAVVFVTRHGPARRHVALPRLDAEHQSREGGRGRGRGRGAGG
mmetsp:Transcript_6120/g.23128  ORF Transcript_6120/g.23128 Transcript_6120/m.23128 type:complete len:289 (+) Transcript_6120:812-1678(+)